jgi:tetratricopeptide (TPR) repeat protein
MNRKFLFISIFVLLTSFFLANYLLAAARTFLVSGNASSFNVEYSLNKNFDLIDELTESGETEKATLEMAKAFRSQGTASGYYASAKLLQDIGKYQEAIYDFEKAIELNLNPAILDREQKPDN